MQWGKLLSTERLKGAGTVPDASRSDRRSPFERDFDRIAYSTPFRRLQNKTQVHTLPNNDHVRNRLTHSLEASTLARSLGTDVGNWLKEVGDADAVPGDLGACAQAATLAHDIGNPPFGHPGEDAIRDWFTNEEEADHSLHLTKAELRDFTGFNGNAQGFRILTRYNLGYDSLGLQLTCATLAAFAKYPRATSSSATEPWDETGIFSADEEAFKLIAERTGLHLVSPGVWCRHPLAFLVEAADDIAYLTADIEDGVELGILPLEETKTLFHDLIGPTQTLPRESALSRLRATLIGTLMSSALEEFKRDYDCIMSGQRRESLLEQHAARRSLKGLAQSKIFASTPQLRRDLAGREALEGLLKRLARTVCMFKDCKWSLPLLKKKSRHRWRLLTLIEASAAESGCLSALGPMAPDSEVLHRIVDYIASGTDRYAIELWQNVRGVRL
jgi:dGTPase